MKKIIVIALSLLGLSGCGFFLASTCTDTIKTEVKSPDGNYAATLYERDCGATTDFSTIVNIRAGSSKFNSDENVIFVAKGTHKVNLMWNDGKSLHIECIECDTKDVYKEEKS